MLPWFACAGGGSITGMVNEIAMGFVLVGSATIFNWFLLDGRCQFAGKSPISPPLEFLYCRYVT